MCAKSRVRAKAPAQDAPAPSAYTCAVLETLIGGAIGLLTAVIAYMLEQRIGDRLDAIEARQLELEAAWYGEDD